MSLRNLLQRYHNPRVPVNYELIFSICSGVSFEYLRDIFPQSTIVKLMQLPLFFSSYKIIHPLFNSFRLYNIFGKALYFYKLLSDIKYTLEKYYVFY